MTNEIDRARWLEIDAVFKEVLELEPREWEAFLDRRCSDDSSLADVVRDLLAADRASKAFLAEPIAASFPEAIAEALVGDSAEPVADRTGERVGAFRLVRPIGRGGMAGVYEAARADGAFDQRVAIKFLRRGLDTEDFVRRFVTERRILSSLEHPNIARLVDGGTADDGLPYLALEYVEGSPIHDYCDRSGCTLEDRLRLFVQVAQAVQHAHANLVVHRDIKPSNILVTADGQVKLLDFGIAKLLDPEVAAGEAPLTRTGVRPLTPEYASPEQVRGGPITTASDIYQLGLLLYRLLTGERPCEVHGRGETLDETISRSRPKPPSEAVRQRSAAESGSRVGRAPGRLSRRLRGDLDTIVLKALRKEPRRRYATALEMADDVRRHLDGEPIMARRESSLYRASKFLRRNAWVAPVTAVGLALAGAYVVTVARHARELERERNVARDVQRSFVSFFTAPDSGDTGLGEGRRDLTILQAIRDGTERVRRDLADRPAARAELFGAMAAVLQDVDEPTQALELAEEALELERTLYGEASPEVHRTLLLVGRLHSDVDSARSVLRRRLALSRTLYGPDHAETAASLHALGQVEFQGGDVTEAIARMDEAIETYRSVEPARPRQLAEALSELAGQLGALGREDEAVPAAREAYDILRRELGDDHSRTAIAGSRLAQGLNAAGRLSEARALYESSLAVLNAELGATHATTMEFRGDHAIVLRLLGDAAAAERAYRELLAIQRERYGPVDAQVAGLLQNLAVTVKDQGRFEEAERLSIQAHEMFEETLGSTNFLTGYPLLTTSEIRLIREDHEGAEAVSREALQILRAALPPGHFAVSVAECRIGQALAGQGRTVEARPYLERGSAALLEGLRPEVEAYFDACVAALEELG